MHVRVGFVGVLLEHALSLRRALFSLAAAVLFSSADLHPDLTLSRHIDRSWARFSNEHASISSSFKDDLRESLNLFLGLPIAR